MIIKNSWSCRKDYIVSRTISTTRRFSRHAKVSSFSLLRYFYFLFNTEGPFHKKNKQKKQVIVGPKTSFSALKPCWSIFSTFQSIPNLILCKNTIFIPCMWNFSWVKVTFGTGWGVDPLDSASVLEKNPVRGGGTCGGKKSNSSWVKWGAGTPLKKCPWHSNWCIRPVWEEDFKELVRWWSVLLPF